MLVGCRSCIGVIEHVILIGSWRTGAEGCKLDMQVQYASIGWSVGATLGLSAAAKVSDRRVFAIIGVHTLPSFPPSSVFLPRALYNTETHELPVASSSTAGTLRQINVG